MDSIGGQTAKEYLLQQQEGETPMAERTITHELIVVITNQGYTDQVMDAARAAGATGGTSIHAKGTGTELAKRFFGVSIASEREMVFILARAEDKKPIMKAVMERAGMRSEAQSLVFSLPVSDLAASGLWIQSNEKPARPRHAAGPAILFSKEPPVPAAASTLRS